MSRLSMAVFKEGVTYVVVERIDRRYDQYAIEMISDIPIGQRIRFVPDYHGGGAWAFDSPVEIQAVDADVLEHKGDYKTLARLRASAPDIVFALDYRNFNASYMVVEEEFADAILSGVPPQDVFA